MLFAFTSAAYIYIQVYLRPDLFREANNMNPDQEQSDLGPYCLQYRLPKNISMASNPSPSSLKIKTVL